jgi:hypothetical protein
MSFKLQQHLESSSLSHGTTVLMPADSEASQLQSAYIRHAHESQACQLRQYLQVASHCVMIRVHWQSKPIKFIS